MLHMSDIEVVVHKHRAFDMGDNDRVLVLEEMNHSDFGGAGGDDEPFLAETADILASVASVVGDSTVSSLPEIMHSSNFELKLF